MKRRVVTLLLVCLTILGMLASCTPSESGDSATPPASNTPAGNNSNPSDNGGNQDTDPYAEHLVISMSVIDADKAGIDAATGELAANLKWLYEKFNFEFEFYPLTWDNYIDQTRLWMAGGTAPDLMMFDVAPVRYPEFINNVKDGLLRPYTGYENYPALKEKMDKATSGKQFIVDGELYAWPGFGDNATYNFQTMTGFLYRKDWAQAVGLYQEDMVYTWDEFQALIKTVIEQDPGGNGAGNTIGLMGEDWMLPKYFGGGSISPYMLQYGPDGDGGYTWGPLLPESLDAVKLVNQMYKDGLLWTDQIMVKSEDVGNKFTANQLFASISQNTSASFIRERMDSFKGVNGGDPYEVIDFGFFEGPDGKILSYQANDHWSQEAMSSNITDEKAERWMAILDYLVSDEGYYFRNLGIPGVDWHYEGDMPVIDWVGFEDDGVTPLYPYKEAGTWNWGRAAGNSDNFSLYNPAVPKKAQEIIFAGYDILMSDKTRSIPFNVELNYFLGANYSEIGTMEESIYQQVAALLLSNNVEADWNAWIESKRDLVQPAIDELNAALK